MARSDDLLHLVRLAGARNKSWQLRLPSWHPLGGWSFNYSDSEYGGEQEALAAARRARDAMFATAGLPLSLPGRVRDTRSQSGMVGVTLACKSRDRVKPHFEWSANWVEDGRQLRKHFGIQRYGFKEALLQAVALREQKTGVKFAPEQIEQALALEATYQQALKMPVGERASRERPRPVEESQRLHVSGQGGHLQVRLNVRR